MKSCCVKVEIRFLKENDVNNYFELCLAALYISPIMNVLHASVFEGDVVEIVCKVVNPPGNVEVFLTKDKRILKKASGSLVHRLTAKDSDSGEFVCKAEQGNVQKETYRSITVKGKYLKYPEMSSINYFKRRKNEKYSV